MRRPSRFAASITIVVAIAALLDACGGRKVVAPVTQSGAPFAAGTWYGTFTIHSVSGDAGCSSDGATFVDSFTVVMGTPSDLIFGSCDFTMTGTQFTQTCRDTLENSPTCVAIETLNGGGSVNGNYFSGSWTSTFHAEGSCLSWPYHDCTSTITGSGQRVPGSGPAR